MRAIRWTAPRRPPRRSSSSASSANWDALKAEADALYAKKDALRRMLEESGGPTDPAQVGCRGEDVRDALLCAWLLRPRFTLLKLAFDLGCLEEIVDEVLA